MIENRKNNFDEFYKKIARKLLLNLNNNFKDNWDTKVKGNIPKLNLNDGIKLKLYKCLKRLYRGDRIDLNVGEIIAKFDAIIKKHGSGLSDLYQLLSDDYSKDFLIEIIAFRILGYQKIKLRTNNKTYWENRNIAESLKGKKVEIESGLKNKELSCYNLDSMNIPIRLISYPPAITHTFLERHYEYHQGDISIDIEEGDIVVDAGAAWGDTS